MQVQERLLVPTFTNKKDTEELDLHSMTEEDLMLLQKKAKHALVLVVVVLVVVAAVAAVAAIAAIVVVPISLFNGDDPLSQSCCFLLSSS